MKSIWLFIKESFRSVAGSSAYDEGKQMRLSIIKIKQNKL